MSERGGLASGRGKLLKWLPWFVVVAGLAATVASAVQIHTVEAARREALFDAWSEQFRERARKRVEDYVLLLRGLAGIFAASERVTDDEFHRYTLSLRLEEHYPAVVGLGTAFRLTSPKELEEFNVEMRSFARNKSRDDREVYFPTVYFAPGASSFARLRGYDMLSHPSAQAALRQCWEDSRPVVSPALRVWPEDEAERQPASRQMLLFSPLDPPEFPEDLPIRPPDTRWRGVVFALVQADVFWTNTFGDDISDDFGVWVVQADSEGDVVWTNTDSEELPRDDARLVTGEVSVAGGQWTIIKARANRASTLAAQWPEYYLAASTLALGLLLTVALYFSTRSQTRAWLLAEARAGQLRRAQDELRRANSHLEDRVAERTAEAEQRAAQLRKMAVELTNAEQKERRRLAEVLHDHLQQLLVASRLQASTLSRRVRDAELQPFLTSLHDLLGESIDASRNLSVELSPPILREGGVQPALRWLSRWMQEKYNLNVDLDAEPGVELEDDNLRILAFQAVSELLFNIVKHAGVDRAAVELRRVDDTCLKIVVSDRGQGFDLSQDQQQRAHGGFGLLSIRERIELMGGGMDIWSETGKGTRITLRLPFSPPTDCTFAVNPQPAERS